MLSQAQSPQGGSWTKTSEILPVAILAGGLATRLRPLTEKIPKALIEVRGEPFVSHQLRLLRGSGIRRAVLCVGYLGEMVRDFVGNGSAFGLDVTYSFDGAQPRGTGGSVRAALPLLGDAFFVLYGDSYLPCDYAGAAAAFRASEADGLMTVFRNDGQWDTSNVEFADGRIVAYDKQQRTQRMRHIDYGLGAFRAGAFAGLPEDPLDLAVVYQRLLGSGRLAGFEVAQRFYEVGSFQGIDDLEQYLARL